MAKAKFGGRVFQGWPPLPETPQEIKEAHAAEKKYKAEEKRLAKVWKFSFALVARELRIPMKHQSDALAIAFEHVQSEARIRSFSNPVTESEFQTLITQALMRAASIKIRR